MTSEEYQSKFGHTSRWRGRRVFAVDGVKYNLQRHPDLDAAFGRPTNGICPQVLSSTLYDVCAKMPVDLRVSSCGSNERDHLDAMLHHLKPGDLIVLDRGYPSFELIRKLKSMGVDFLIRLTSAWNVATQMFAGDEEDCAVALDPPKRSPNGWEPIAARAIKLTNHDGEESVYLSSLSESEISTECIRELYHMRWEEEEFYKMTKSNYIGQGQFRARNPSGIVQEIHALELFLAVSRYLMAVAADVEGKPIDEVGQKGAVLAVADYVVRVFLQSDENAATEDLIALIKRITRHRYRKRPGRSFVRRSFKPNPRWTPRGHRRG